MLLLLPCMLACFDVGWSEFGVYTAVDGSVAASAALNGAMARCSDGRLRAYVASAPTSSVAALCLTPAGRNSTGMYTHVCAEADYSPRLGTVARAFIGLCIGIITGSLLCMVSTISIA